MARMACHTVSFEPGMAVHVFKGTSQMRDSACAVPVAARYRDRISTSKTYLVRKGAANTSRTGSVTRKSFTPHCVSYTLTPSATDAAVANTRPQ
jgi:hypothetical protein